MNKVLKSEVFKFGRYKIICQRVREEYESGKTNKFFILQLKRGKSVLQVLEYWES